MSFLKSQLSLSHKNGWIWFKQLRKINCFIFEAARNYHEEAFTTIKNFLADKQILGADFNYAKYSSKMPNLLTGETPNVFSDRFAGGALMDLGIYPLYAAVRLFGKAQDATYQAQQLDNSMDLNGDGILFYPDYQVHIKAGKNITSNLPCEIYTTDGTLRSTQLSMFVRLFLPTIKAIKSNSLSNRLLIR